MTYSASPMKSKGLTPKPDVLPKSYVWCCRHATGGPKGWKCGACAYLPASAESATTTKTHSRPGLDNEIALAAALLDAGLVGFEAQFPWGMWLTPARRFASDLGYPKHRVMVESVGGVHATKRNVNKDCERSALAASIGVLIVPCHPGMIRDGSAVELVAKAIKAASAAGATT